MRLCGDSTSDPVLFTSIEADTGVPIENPARNGIRCSEELDSKFGSSFSCKFLNYRRRAYNQRLSEIIFRNQRNWHVYYETSYTYTYNRIYNIKQSNASIYQFCKTSSLQFSRLMQ